jgi:hypothetical protein
VGVGKEQKREEEEEVARSRSMVAPQLECTWCTALRLNGLMEWTDAWNRKMACTDKIVHGLKCIEAVTYTHMIN